MGNANARITDAILEQGVDFGITVFQPNILHKLGILKTEKKFVIYPIKLGTLLKISELLIKAKSDDIKEAKGQRLLDIALRSIVNNQSLVVKIIALAIINKKIVTWVDKYKIKRLEKFLEANIDAKESVKLLNIVINQMDIQSFFGFMVSIRGMNIIETESTSGESSEASSNTSDSTSTQSSGESVGKT